MQAVITFHDRMKKIGIDVKFIGNYPWIYLNKVNGKQVHGNLDADHGFTAFWLPVKRENPCHVNDIGELFKKIRETLKQTE